MASDLAISVRGVYKKYGRRKKVTHVLKGLNMEVPYNTIYSLLGASGCGKTTLLRCILSSLEPDYGEITVLGMEPGIRSSNVPGRDVGYMPQDVGLIVEFSAFELMMFFGALHHMPLKKIRQKIQTLVELLQIPSLYQRIATMSGGEQRRVSFAVALIQDPTLLILDEPTVGLDPLLRVKIWSHLADLTTSQQSTVIITTHYIEEAKMAHTVGLMRDGVLLAQSSPTALLKAYNTTSLEAVFLKLAYASSERNKEESIELTKDQQPKIERKRKLLNHDKIRVPKLTNILAMAAKNFWKTAKSYMRLALVVILPAIQMLFYTACVGGNVKDVKLLNTNNDNVIYGPDNISFSRFYLNNLDPDIFDLEEVSSYASGEDEIRDRDAWATLLFINNYTLNVVQRYRSTCSDIIKNTNTTKEDLIQNATILIALDPTNLILSQLSEYELFSVANRDLIKYVSKLITNSSALYDLNANFNLTRFVYGNADFTFRDFFAPGVAASSAYLSAILVSATSLVLEKIDGMLDRTYVGGVTETELILSQFLLFSVVGIVQVTVIMTIVYGIFDVQMHGNIALAGFIYWLVTLSGVAIGLVVSSLASNLLQVTFLSYFLAVNPTRLSGILWPVEGFPSSIQWVPNLMPYTYAAIGVKAVVSKGMGIGDRQVYEGILITLGWISLYLFLVVLIFRR